MSLINQMLRDLEQRSQQTPSINPTQPLDIQISPIQSHPGRSVIWWAIGLLPIATAGWLFWQSRQTPFPAAVSIQPAVNLPAAHPAEPIQPAVAVAGVVTAEPAATQPLPSETAPTEPTIANIPKPQAAATNTLAIQPQTLPSANPAPAVIPAAQADSNSVATAPKKAKPAAIDSPEQQAEKIYRQINAQMSRLMRQEKLQDVLQLNPHHLAARQQLLQILVQDHAELELKQFLDESLGWFPDNLGFIKTLAHYHVQQKNFAEAIATLERVDSLRIDDTHYLALLAASYQQQQQFSQALTIYQKLAQLQPEKAENWLGLGICADRLEQSQSALKAYQEALAKNTLNSTVVDYINQRLSALPR